MLLVLQSVPLQSSCSPRIFMIYDHLQWKTVPSKVPTGVSIQFLIILKTWKANKWHIVVFMYASVTDPQRWEAFTIAPADIWSIYWRGIWSDGVLTDRVSGSVRVSGQIKISILYRSNLRLDIKACREDSYGVSLSCGEIKWQQAEMQRGKGRCEPLDGRL